MTYRRRYDLAGALFGLIVLALLAIGVALALGLAVRVFRAVAGG